MLSDSFANPLQMLFCDMFIDTTICANVYTRE